MRELAIDFEELAMAMDDHTGEGAHFLDMVTGEYLYIPPDLGDVDADEDPDPASVPAWEREMLPVADAIRAGDERYVPVPQLDSGEIYRLMRDFAASVGNPCLAGKLEVALDGRGAFGRFTRVLAADPAEEQRWYATKQAWFEAEIRAWLHTLDIDPIPRPRTS